MGAGSTNYVLDANVIMAVLISGKAYHREILSAVHCYSIDFIYDEVHKYKSVIKSRAKLSEDAFVRFVFDVFDLITVVPSFVINDQDWQFAATICKGVDSKDVSYVALSKSTGFPLITRDKLLHTGLRKKGFRNVMLFDAFLEEMQG